MISRAVSFFFLLSFILALSACAEEPVATLHGTVTWVYDGDTLNIEPFGKVRLVGIDVPEREASQRDQYLVRQGVSKARLRQAYQNAKKYCIEYVKGQKVGLIPANPSHDRHGRMLAYVKLAEGQILNRVLIEKGYAVVYRRFEFTMKQDFLDAEAKAREAARGLWSGNE